MNPNITVSLAKPTNPLNALIIANPTIIPMNLRDIVYDGSNGFSRYIDDQTIQLVYNFSQTHSFDHGIWVALADVCGGNFSFNWLIKLHQDGVFDDDMWHYASCEKRFKEDPAAQEWLRHNPTERNFQQKSRDHRERNF